MRADSLLPQVNAMWRNEARNNLLALQNSYGLNFATIKRLNLFLLDGLILLNEFCLENVPVWHLH